MQQPSSIRRALLLSAGVGSRLQPITEEIPKCLVPINGVPLLEYWLQKLNAAGIQEILINTHHLPSEVSRFLAESRFAHQVTVVHEERLLGTAGTLKANRDFFRDEPLLLIHADNLSLGDLSEFIAAHEQRPPEAEITMMSFVTDSPKSCGILELSDTGLVKAFHEKVHRPPGNLANAAVYAINSTVTRYITSLHKTEIDFSSDVVPNFLNRIATWENTVYHRDIGTPESYFLAQLECPMAAYNNGTSTIDNLFYYRADQVEALSRCWHTNLIETMSPEKWRIVVHENFDIALDSSHDEATQHNNQAHIFLCRPSTNKFTSHNLYVQNNLRTLFAPTAPNRP